MAWKVWGDVYHTSEATTHGKSQPVIFDKDYVLNSTGVWIVVYNNPTFTSIQMKIWANANDSPSTLLHTSSNSQLKADIHTEANAIKHIWFEFEENPSFAANDTYHFSLEINGYTGDDSSNLAWMIDFPNPVYESGQTVTQNKLSTTQYTLDFEGAPF